MTKTSHQKFLRMKHTFFLGKVEESLKNVPQTLKNS